ncbi:MULTISPECIES: GNAT family N-acetyltransferase [unclassified Streptomyces]|uniref:GNAT family N-acetyltransferase n=1 Tax=unclassified Streptomyces TaxID=2593676 RepID=UPI001BEC8760|nr:MULTISPECIES: GNAT family N-acetyltransferase [unclassified Streptomyces]MBT2408209.1 GNAT family N-acetyltransferase [Streptomyces sp. ISL-21]MBT2607638.1 GNAT family N-acetyltransferase [Streptomyces sp. ISL-87]
MIRTALATDLDAIAALHTRARATYYRGRVPEQVYGGAAELARTREGWCRAVARAGAGGGVLCAEQDGELTGVAAFRTADGETTLTQLHVDPDHWRRGTGAALHAACLDAWRRAGVERVRLEVYEHNLRAQAFYASHGWRVDPAAVQSGSHLTLWLTVGPTDSNRAPADAPDADTGLRGEA